MCLAANLRTRLILPASYIRGSCYDELDAVSTQQDNLFRSADAGTLFRRAGADPRGVSIARPVANPGGREASVWAARRAD